MKRYVPKTQYVCELCNTTYNNEEDALLCESRPVTQDQGVKIGDIVLITAGEGVGQQAKVTRVSACSREYGHYQWEKYWHTVAVTADIIDSWGSRFLLFDSYAVIK